MGAQYIVKKWLLGDTEEAPDVVAYRILDCFPEPIRSCCLKETSENETRMGRDA